MSYILKWEKIMASLSLCMIVKNEEKNLERCLTSCKNLFDEIIIVDTGSSDNTKNIAKKFTKNVIDFVWCDDFSKARNFAFSKAKSEYIMWLDADDVVPKKSLKKLQELKQNLTADVYMLKYNIAFFDGKPTFTYYRERIIKNCPSAVWQGVVHECITPFDKIERLNISINHQKTTQKNSFRNLKIYQKIIKQRQLTPREQYYYGRELFDHQKFKQCAKILNNFVNSDLGWQENIIDACVLLGICYEHLSNEKLALQYYFKTFEYDIPRANVCCLIGDIILKNKKYKQAKYWYENATKCEDITIKGGFVQSDYYNYYPYMQLCYLHYCLGDIDISKKYNQKAKKYKYTEQIKYNEKFFECLEKNI